MMRGPAEVHQRVHGGADRPAGEEHVVDEDHDASLDGKVISVLRTAAARP